MSEPYSHTDEEDSCQSRFSDDPTLEQKSHTYQSSDALDEGHEQMKTNKSEANESAPHSQTFHTKPASESTEENREHATSGETTQKGSGQSEYIKKLNRQPKLPPNPPLEKWFMSRSVFHAIKKTIGRYPAETGGLLLGSIENFHVSAFIFDEYSFRIRRREAVWYPHIESLNEIVENAEKDGLMFMGVVHSHPRRCIHPSGQDGLAAWSNMTSPSNPHLNVYLLPIVQSAADGPFHFYPYIATCHPDGRGRVIVQRSRLFLID